MYCEIGKPCALRFKCYFVSMAHKKAAGSAKNLRDSNPKYRGLKIAWGQAAYAGNIIVRQKWDKYKTWEGVYKGKDFTIHAKIDGVVAFRKKRFKRFDGRTYERTVVEVVSPEEYVIRQKASSVLTDEKSTSSSSPKKAKSSVKKTSPKKEDVKDKKKVADTAVSTGDADDLTKIEWIWPKIQELFNAAWIMTFADLSWSKIWDIRKILKDAWPSFATHDPSTWKKQSTMAKNWKRDDLKKRQDELNGGKE